LEQANCSVALAVTRELGIPDVVALEGMRKARPDPGAVREQHVSVGGRRVRVVDATAANDPESLALLLGGAEAPRMTTTAVRRAIRPASATPGG